jgi:hypothetical protein
MAFGVNVSKFDNPKIREALEVLKQVGSRRKLGIARWDLVLDQYPFSGTVVRPVKLGTRVFREPFYFVVEKVNGHESLRIKPVKGDQWSIGDVYGFFGFHAFEDYVYDMPILVVEGLSDWAVCRQYYKYTLAALSAWVGYRQAFFVSGLTRNLFLGYDLDETGSDNSNRNIDTLSRFGMNVGKLIPAQKDWGKMYEDTFGRKLLGRQMEQFVTQVNKINERLF